MRRFLLGFVVGILTIPVGAFAAAWMGDLKAGGKEKVETRRQKGRKAKLEIRN